eukprot:359232-Chlamydomonas_euryale.AAC.2
MSLVWESAPWHAMLCYAMPCHARWPHAMSCKTMYACTHACKALCPQPSCILQVLNGWVAPQI